MKTTIITALAVFTGFTMAMPIKVSAKVSSLAPPGIPAAPAAPAAPALPVLAVPGIPHAALPGLNVALHLPAVPAAPAAPALKIPAVPNTSLPAAPDVLKKNTVTVNARGNLPFPMPTPPQAPDVAAVAPSNVLNSDTVTVNARDDLAFVAFAPPNNSPFVPVQFGGPVSVDARAIDIELLDHGSETVSAPLARDVANVDVAGLPANVDVDAQN